MHMLDRVIGIVLGVLLGVGIVTAFVFWGSEDTIDKAAIGNGGGSGAQHAGGPPPIRTMTITSAGTPPDSGAPTFDYRIGDRVRVRFDSDATVALEVVGLGIDRSVAAGQPALLEFRAMRAGNFPVIVTASHIGVANIRVAGGGSVP